MKLNQFLWPYICNVYLCNIANTSSSYIGLLLSASLRAEDIRQLATPLAHLHTSSKRIIFIKENQASMKLVVECAGVIAIFL